jgi:threonine dehydrogenase-like Zn-dependent dehydrogenase
VKYPFLPGYAAFGVVEEIGMGVEGFRTGQRVAMRFGHASAHVAPASSFLPVPDEVSDEDAPWFSLAKIAAMCVPAVKPGPGSSIAVVGAGPIGQMALRWCAAAGAFPLIAVDIVPKRLEMAKAGGASHCVAKPLGQAIEELKEICGGVEPGTIIDSTGHWQVFADAQKAVRKFGKLVLLGDTGAPDKQHLSHDLMHKGFWITATWDCHETPEWDAPTITRLFFQLVKTGRFPLKGLNTHRFAPEDCVAAYAVANERRSETMGIWFDWR